MARQLERCYLLQDSLQTVPGECVADPLTLAGKKRCQFWSEEAGGDLAVFESEGGGGDLALLGMVME